MNSGKRNTPPYRPKPSVMKRKIEPARSRFLSTRKFDHRMLVARRQLPPEHRRERHAGDDAQPHDQRVVEPVLLAPFLEHVLQRGEADDQQADAEPVDRSACVASHVGGSWRKVVTRNAATMPIGTLMKKHQLQ